MKTNIPIYRAEVDCDKWDKALIKITLVPYAKKINNKYYIEGRLNSFDEIEYTDKDKSICKFKIKLATLAIHFPDMIDSDGTKIFASLSEDGKGGDTSKITWSHPSNGSKETVKYIFKYHKGKIGWVGRSYGDIREAEWNKVTGIQE